jgi:hypothetical protein
LAKLKGGKIVIDLGIGSHQEVGLINDKGDASEGRIKDSSLGIKEAQVHSCTEVQQGNEVTLVLNMDGEERLPASDDSVSHISETQFHQLVSDAAAVDQLALDYLEGWDLKQAK